jgi:hypothetical protein
MAEEPPSSSIHPVFNTLDAVEAKALVAVAFRNGPLENLHAGQPCPTCSQDPGYSRITQSEMRGLMKYAVNVLARLLALRREDSKTYYQLIGWENLNYAQCWDLPEKDTDLEKFIAFAGPAPTGEGR